MINPSNSANLLNGVIWHQAKTLIPEDSTALITAVVITIALNLGLRKISDSKITVAAAFKVADLMEMIALNAISF